MYKGRAKVIITKIYVSMHEITDIIYNFQVVS